MNSLSIDPKTTALIMIDLQNAIVGRTLAPYSGAQVVERAAKLASAFRERKACVVWIHVLMGEIFAAQTDAPPMNSATPPPPSASELVPQIQRQPSDLVIPKRQWGAFYGNDLDQQLRRRGIRTIVLGGIATNYGVESTARAAHERAYEQIFVEDAMTSMDADSHRFAVEKIFPRLGRTRSTEEVLAALQ